mmetsp:Transcript_92330/g.282649  ORF Transcript_92330/g.282649 Transcript_92330/m.282649 type:complete len:211 (-) Transcript_92330:1380-2012(-)
MCTRFRARKVKADAFMVVSKLSNRCIRKPNCFNGLDTARATRIPRQALNTVTKVATHTMIVTMVWKVSWASFSFSSTCFCVSAFISVASLEKAIAGRPMTTIHCKLSSSVNVFVATCKQTRGFVRTETSSELHAAKCPEAISLSSKEKSGIEEVLGTFRQVPYRSSMAPPICRTTELLEAVAWVMWSLEKPGSWCDMPMRTPSWSGKNSE